MCKNIYYLIIGFLFCSCIKYDSEKSSFDKVFLISNEIYLNLDTLKFIEKTPGITFLITLKNQSLDTFQILSRNSEKSGLDTNYQHSILLLGDKESFVLNSYYSHDFLLLPNSELKIPLYLSLKELFLYKNGSIPIKNIEEISNAYLNKLNDIKFIELNFVKKNSKDYTEKLFGFKIDRTIYGNF